MGVIGAMNHIRTMRCVTRDLQNGRRSFIDPTGCSLQGIGRTCWCWITDKIQHHRRNIESASAPQFFTLSEKRQAELGITPRELEILELIANGLSNREIAEKLFVSENTVKTHSSRLFDKLSARRRTQAVQLGKELGLIP